MQPLEAAIVAAAVLLGSHVPSWPQPAAPSTSPEFSHYCQALRLYADGDVDAALAAVESWPIADLRRIVAQTTRCMGRGSTAAHAVVFITDLAVAHVAGPVSRIADYLNLGASMLGAVQPDQLGTADRAAVLAFHEDWFAVASRLLLAWTDPVAASSLIDRGRGAFNGAFKQSSRLRTLSGAAMEMRAHLANPNIHDRRYIDQMPRDQLRALLVEAEGEFRQALAIDPHNAEARAHLGRVLYLRKETTAAREVLAAATADAHASSRWQYLAHLFAGALEEFEGDRVAARREYEAAMAILPGAQTPYIALSFVESGLGNRQRAADLVAGWVDQPSDEDDPWSDYQNGGFELDELVALRARVKE